MRRRWLSAGLALIAAVGAAGCGSSGSSSAAATASGGATAQGSSGTIVIGATIPLTGAFAAFGQQEKIGDNLAVSEVNAAGGITINGKKEKVVVDYIDSQSQPNLTTTQARTLALQDHAVGFFGTIAPPLVIPLSQVADQIGGKQNPGTSGVAVAYTCAKVLLDGIAKAGSTSGSAINQAISATNGLYAVGQVRFNSQNFSAVKAVQTQWRNGSTVVVWPKVAGGSSVQSPVAGLQ